MHTEFWWGNIRAVAWSETRHLRMNCAFCQVIHDDLVTLPASYSTGHGFDSRRRGEAAIFTEWFSSAPKEKYWDGTFILYNCRFLLHFFQFAIYSLSFDAVSLYVTAEISLTEETPNFVRS
jgi:hypothetical protein